MDSSTLLIIAILIGLVIVANVAETRPDLRPLVIIFLGTISVGFIGLLGPFQPRATPMTTLFALVFGGAALASLFGPIRFVIRRALPERAYATKGPDEGQLQGFDPNSPVHLTAWVLCILLIGYTLLTYMLVGGQSGLANTLEGGRQVTSPANLIAQMAIWLIFALVGVGFGTRRPLPVVLNRLGLRAPTLGELAVGAVMAFMLIGSVIVVSTVWSRMVSPEELAQQTEASDLIARSVTTLTGAFILALTAAIGEEIAFRGAIQPVLGLWPTTILFALTHIQYTLTPAALVIVLVGYGMGWLRKYVNTTSAILAHFLYNFIPIAIVIYGQYLIDTMGTLR